MHVFRWNESVRPCRTCREKKRRCDRKRPCSNCSLRQMRCVYADDAVSRPPATTTSLDAQDVLSRLGKLETAVFESHKAPVAHTTLTPPPQGSSPTRPTCTPFTSHLFSESSRKTDKKPSLLDHVVGQLPPVEQARLLLEHFSAVVQPNWGVAHMPTVRNILEKTYKDLTGGSDVLLEDLFLLFTLFAAAAHQWSPQLLQQLNADQAEAKAALSAYMRLSNSILDHEDTPVVSSTTSLTAVCLLAYLSIHSRGLSNNVQVLCIKCVVMARSIGVERLDAPKGRQAVWRGSLNMIDAEIRRRIWWNMVGSDWLNSFSGGTHEGSYLLHPRHMHVNLPSHAIDEDITPERIQTVPMSVPTTMSAFLSRVDLACVCREVIDTVPLAYHEHQELEYETILALDKKFRDFFDRLPIFLKTDSDSIEQCRELVRKQPILALQRSQINFAGHTRLCRLHRPFHFDEQRTDPAATYSQDACIRAAQKVLELRRMMDDIGPVVGVSPARSWIVMQHVFVAGLILATNFAANPSGPEAAALKAKVLATCETLERSQQESGATMRGVQENIRELMARLQNGGSIAETGQPAPTTETLSSPSFLDQMELDDWDQLWTDLVGAVPGLTEWDQCMSGSSEVVFGQPS